MIHFKLLIGLLLFVPPLAYAETAAEGAQQQKEFTTSAPAENSKELAKGDNYVIKEKATQKYECRCFRWTKTGNYRVVHSMINSEHTTTNFLEDLERGGTIANFRWDAKENRLKYEDAPFLDKKSECFNPMANLKILKQSGGKVLAMGHNADGTDVSTWVESGDLEKIDKNSPEFAKRKSPAPITANPCNS